MTMLLLVGSMQINDGAGHVPLRRHELVLFDAPRFSRWLIMAYQSWLAHAPSFSG
jgi:hypothetical protein